MTLVVSCFECGEALTLTDDQATSLAERRAGKRGNQGMRIECLQCGRENKFNEEGEQYLVNDKPPRRVD